MSHNFKPGDLALIVGAHTFPENIGAVVELISFLRAGQQYQNSEAVTITARGDCWEVSGDSIIGGYIGQWTGRVVRTPKHGLADPAHLMPLRGDFAPEQAKSLEVSA